LNGNLDSFGDPLDVLEVLGSARPRSVEVDDVKRASPLLGPAARGVGRVGVVHGLALIVAPHQADSAATANVDGRIEDHAGPAASSDACSQRTGSHPRCGSFNPCASSPVTSPGTRPRPSAPPSSVECSKSS